MGCQNSISKVETREGGKYHLSSFGRKAGLFFKNNGCTGTFDSLASMKGPALNLPSSPWGSSGFRKDHELEPMRILSIASSRDWERASARNQERTYPAGKTGPRKLSCQGLLDHDGHARDIPDQKEHIEETGVV
jgi:hypothetical protein